jgi:hypothetical protein
MQKGHHWNGWWNGWTRARGRILSLGHGDPKIEDDDDDKTPYTPRRRPTQPKKCILFRRRSHNVGLNYSTSINIGKKKKMIVKQ